VNIKTDPSAVDADDFLTLTALTHFEDVDDRGGKGGGKGGGKKDWVCEVCRESNPLADVIACVHEQQGPVGSSAREDEGTEGGEGSDGKTDGSNEYGSEEEERDEFM
jgi:hypothetical protein